MTWATPSEAIRNGACPLCLGDGETFHIVEDRLGPCSGCGGSGRLGDLLERSCQLADCPDHGGQLDAYFPAGRPAWAEGYLAAKPLDTDDEWLVVSPLTFDRARLQVCEPGPWGHASLEHWCMNTPAEALAAWLAWPRTPTAWNRHQRRDGVLEWPDHDEDLERADG